MLCIPTGVQLDQMQENLEEQSREGTKIIKQTDVPCNKHAQVRVDLIAMTQVLDDFLLHAYLEHTSGSC